MKLQVNGQVAQSSRTRNTLEVGSFCTGLQTKFPKAYLLELWDQRYLFVSFVDIFLRSLWTIMSSINIRSLTYTLQTNEEEWIGFAFSDEKGNMAGADGVLGMEDSRNSIADMFIAVRLCSFSFAESSALFSYYPAPKQTQSIGGIIPSQIKTTSNKKTIRFDGRTVIVCLLMKTFFLNLRERSRIQHHLPIFRCYCSRVQSSPQVNTRLKTRFH